MKSIYIAITAHNPLHRVEKTLKVLKGYEDLELEKEVDIYIDHNHRHDIDEFSLIVASHTNFNRVGFVSSWSLSTKDTIFAGRINLLLLEKF